MSFQSSEGPALVRDRRLWRRPLVGVLVITGLVLVAAIAGWFARKPIATRLISQWCNQHDLSCDFKINQLGFDHAAIHDITVSGPSVDPLLEARTVSVEYTLSWLFSPTVTAISITNPVLQAGFDGSRFTLDGLENLITPNRGDAENTTLPDLQITGGHIDLTTPAGQLSGTFSVAGTPATQTQAELVFAPANLRKDSDVLTLNAGYLELVYAEGQIDGTLELAVDVLTLEALHAENLTATAHLNGAEQFDLDWQLNLENLSHRDGFRLAQAELSGNAVLQAADEQIPLDIDAIEALTARGTAQTMAALDYATATAAMAFELDVKRTSPGHLSLQAQTDLTETTSPVLNASTLTLRFDGGLENNLTSLSGTGNMFVSDGALTSGFSEAMLASLPKGGAIQAHSTQLRASLLQALSGFTTAASFRLDATAQDDWQLIFPEAIALQSQSGLSVALTPDQARPAISLHPGIAEIAGIFALDGGDLPRFDADIRQLRIAGSDVHLQTGGLKLQPWRVHGTAFSAELNRFEFENSQQRLAIAAIGELRVDGNLAGMSLTDTRLFGGIDAVKDAANWRVQTLNQDCLGFNIGTAKGSSGLTVGPLALNICPENGRFIQQTATGSNGRILLGDIAFPFTASDTSGTATFADATLEWSASDYFDMQIVADTLDLAMLIGGRSLDLEATAPRAGLTLTQQTSLRADIGQSNLTGDLIPANVTIDEAEFTGQFASTGFTGRAETGQVELTDFRDDPLYQPLHAELMADFVGPNLTLTGPIRLASSGQVVADANLAMHLLDLNGTGHIASRPLTFTPDGLQPKALSDRVRDVLTNGRGGLSGVADFTIIGGALSGTAQVEVKDFGFDTLRLGAMDGINGSLYFNDILSITTPPGQRMTIASMNLGIPLEAGEVTFQIVDGTRVEIADAQWPFAGGNLSLAPATWTIAGVSDTLIINANQLELAALIETFSLPDITADGTLSGTFPIELVSGAAMIRQAQFAVDQDGGTLAYTGNAAAQAGAGDERVGAAFTALRDFRFKILEVGLDGNLIDDVTVSVRLLGRNPEVYGGAEFDFNISIAAKLAQLIRSSRRAPTLSWLTDAIVLDPEPETDEPFN